MNFVLLLYVLFGILGASVLQFFTPGLPIGSVTTVDMAILLYVFEIFNLGRAVERAHRLEIEMMAKYQRELEITVDEAGRNSSGLSFTPLMASMPIDPSFTSEMSGIAGSSA